MKNDERKTVAGISLLVTAASAASFARVREPRVRSPDAGPEHGDSLNPEVPGGRHDCISRPTFQVGILTSIKAEVPPEQPWTAPHHSRVSSVALNRLRSATEQLGDPGRVSSEHRTGIPVARACSTTMRPISPVPPSTSILCCGMGSTHLSIWTVSGLWHMYLDTV